MEKKKFLSKLVCAVFAVGTVFGAAKAGVTSYMDVAKTICADFTGEKILQDTDVMGKFLEKKLNASAETALSTGEDIIKDLNGGNFYCFDQKTMVQFLTSKIPAN